MEPDDQFYNELVVKLVVKAKAEILREVAKELATLQYVRPSEPGREEYEAMLAIRRGNTDAWLKKRADEIEGKIDG